MYRGTEWHAIFDWPKIFNDQNNAVELEWVARSYTLDVFMHIALKSDAGARRSRLHFRLIGGVIIKQPAGGIERPDAAVIRM